MKSDILKAEIFLPPVGNFCIPRRMPPSLLRILPFLALPALAQAAPELVYIGTYTGRPDSATDSRIEPATVDEVTVRGSHVLVSPS